jgi:transposase
MTVSNLADFLKEWCQWARDTGIRQMQQLAQTLTAHAGGILNGWEHRISNGRMEGINNKIKTLLRQIDGLRDERYFTLKLYSLHDSRLTLLG